MAFKEKLLGALGNPALERELFARRVALWDKDHPYRNLPGGYPAKARRLLLLREVAREIKRDDLKEEVFKRTGFLPSATIQLLPEDVFTVWAGRRTLAQYLPDTIWIKEEDEHLLLHEMLHSVQQITSGTAARRENLILLTEAFTEETVVSWRSEKGLYLLERRALQDMLNSRQIEELAPFQGEALLARLPDNFFNNWLAKLAKERGSLPL